MSIRKIATGDVLAEDEDQQPVPENIQATGSRQETWTPQDEQQLATESARD